MSGITSTQVQQGMSVLTQVLQGISNVFSSAKAQGTTVDKPTMVATVLEMTGVGAASMLTGGAAATATWAVPLGESLISEAVNFFEQLHNATPATTQAAPVQQAAAPTPAPVVDPTAGKVG